MQANEPFGPFGRINDHITRILDETGCAIQDFLLEVQPQLTIMSAHSIGLGALLGGTELLW